MDQYRIGHGWMYLSRVSLRSWKSFNDRFEKHPILRAWVHSIRYQKTPV